MFTLWYLSLGWKEYNKPFRKQSPDEKSEELAKKPDLIPDKKVPEPPKPVPPEPLKPKIPEPPPPKKPEPPPKQPEPPKPKAPEPPPPKQAPPPPPPKQPSPPKPKPQEPPKPKTPTAPGAKAPEFPSPKPQPSKKPETPKTPEPPKPLGKQTNNSGARPSDFNGAGPKAESFKSPKDLSYGKFESGENLPDRNFHLTEAKFQENLDKSQKYVEKPVISNPDSLESSEEED